MCTPLIAHMAGVSDQTPHMLYISLSPLLYPLQFHQLVHFSACPIDAVLLKVWLLFKTFQKLSLCTLQNSIWAGVRSCRSCTGSICSPFPLLLLLATSRPHAGYTLYNRHFCTHTFENVALSALLFTCVFLLKASLSIIILLFTDT